MKEQNEPTVSHEREEALANQDFTHAETMARRAGHDKALATTPEEFARALRREDRWHAKARDAFARAMAARQASQAERKG